MAAEIKEGARLLDECSPSGRRLPFARGPATLCKSIQAQRRIGLVLGILNRLYVGFGDWVGTAG